MRLIFEENVEKSDFIELILSPTQYQKMEDKGIVANFPKGLFGKRNLNVFVRVDQNYEENKEDAIEKRNIKENNLNEYQNRSGSRKAPKTSSGNSTRHRKKIGGKYS
jgi:hypothetical protein